LHLHSMDGDAQKHNETAPEAGIGEEDDDSTRPPEPGAENPREGDASSEPTPRDLGADDGEDAVEDHAAAGDVAGHTESPPPEPEDEGPTELFEFRLQVYAKDGNGTNMAVHTKSERDDTFPSRNTVKVASKQKYTLVFQVANTLVPFDSLLAVRVGEFDVPITKQLRRNNDFICEGEWDTWALNPTGDGFRIQMPVRVAYLLGGEKHCRETEFILQMKVYDSKDNRKAHMGGTPLDCISCKFYRTSSRSVDYPTFLRS